MDKHSVFFHKTIVDNLVQLLDQDQLAHAIILSGADGSGNLELGVQLANQIVSRKISNPSPERIELALSKAEKFIHPDVHYSFPFYGQHTSNDFLADWRSALGRNLFMNITEWMMHLDAENKQANINAKECHSIIQKLGLKSFESDYKVLLMWLPEYLGKEGNRVLKLIEEPPENTVFILVTNQIESILNTILSRCQLIKVPNPSDEEIKNRLKSELKVDENSAEKITFLAEGNFRIAKNMSDDKIIDFSEKLFEWLRTCYKLKPEDTLKWCDGFSKLKKEQQKYFIQYALQFFRAFLVIDVLEKSQMRFSPNELEVAEKLKRFINLETLGSIEELLDNSFMMIERNANVKMLFMRNSIRIHELFYIARSA